MSTSEDRERIAEEKRLAHLARISMVIALKDGGNSNAVIARVLGIPENEVRIMLKSPTVK